MPTYTFMCMYMYPPTLPRRSKRRAWAPRCMYIYHVYICLHIHTYVHMFTFLFIYLHIYLGLSGFKSTPSTSISIYRYPSIDIHLSISIYRYLSIDIHLSISIYRYQSIHLSRSKAMSNPSISIDRSIHPSIQSCVHPPTHRSTNLSTQHTNNIQHMT